MKSWQERVQKLGDLKKQKEQEELSKYSRSRQRLEAIQSRIEPICNEFSKGLGWRFDQFSIHRWFVGEHSKAIVLNFSVLADSFSVSWFSYGTEKLVSTIDMNKGLVEEELTEALEKAFKILYGVK